MRKPKITVIGGGTGIPVILKSLREKDVEIAAIVTVADDGGSSGTLRDYLNILCWPSIGKSHYCRSVRDAGFDL